MGLPPFVTPSKFAVSVDIDADEIDAVPDASIFTVPAFCWADGFVIWNENSYCVPDATRNGA
jgi:hypothetical protein